jgi:hypothetical protein
MVIRYVAVTVQTCYSSPWTLWSSLVVSEWWRFIGETELLACYDLFFVSGRKTTALFSFYIQFGWPRGDKVTTGGKVVMRLACADCMTNMAVWNQPMGDEFLYGRESVDSNPSGRMKRRSRKIPVLKNLAFWINRWQTTSVCAPVSINSTALHFGSLNLVILLRAYTCKESCNISLLNK